MSVIDWTKQRLGQRPDAEVARELGVTVKIVGRARRGLKIAPYPSASGPAPTAPTPEEVAHWVRLYRDEGLLLREIVERRDVQWSKPRVSEAIRRELGIERLRPNRREGL